MKVYIPMLDKNEAAIFFGYNCEQGWLEYRDSSLFHKIFVLDELAFCEQIKAKYSSDKDLVLEEPDLAEEYRKLFSIERAKAFIDEIQQRIMNGGDC